MLFLWPDHDFQSHPCCGQPGIQGIPEMSGRPPGAMAAGGRCRLHVTTVPGGWSQTAPRGKQMFCSSESGEFHEILEICLVFYGIWSFWKTKIWIFSGQNPEVSWIKVSLDFEAKGRQWKATFSGSRMSTDSLCLPLGSGRHVASLMKFRGWSHSCISHMGFERLWIRSASKHAAALGLAMLGNSAKAVLAL